jgi:hypothetical protein
MDDETISPVPNVDRVLEAILQMLQAEPRRYRDFGVYWWAVKRILKEHGYGPDQLYLLGPFTDPEAESHLPVETDAYLLAEAIHEQQYRATFEFNSPDCYYPDTGEPYHLYDEDAGV